MEHNWLLTCLMEDALFDIEIDHDYQGRLPWLNPINNEELLVLEKKEEWWIQQGKQLQVEEQKLRLDYLYSCHMSSKKQVFLFCESLHQSRCIFQNYELSKKSLRIGRGSVEIQYNHEYVSQYHAKLIWEHENWVIMDTQSRNGIYVNRKRVSRQSLQCGDCIYIMGLQIIMGNGFISLNNPHDKVSIERAKLKPFVPKQVPLPCRLEAIQIYPFHQDTASFSFTPISLQDPPAMLKQERLPLLYMLGPSFTMGLASMSGALFTLQNALVSDIPLSSVFPTLIMSCSMMLGTMVWPIFIQRYELRREKRKEGIRQKIYHEYLKKVEQQIHYEESKYQRFQQNLYSYDVQKLLRGDYKGLYQVNYIEEGASIVLGWGKQKFPIAFDASKAQLKIQEDILEKDKDAFLKTCYNVENIPALIPLESVKVLLVQGAHKDVSAYAQYLILQLCIHYIPKQIQLVLAFPQHMVEFLPFRFLAHVFDEQGRRYVLHSMEQARQIAMYIHQIQIPTVIFSFSSELSSALHMEELSELAHVTCIVMHDIEKQRMLHHASISVEASHFQYQFHEQYSIGEWKNVQNPRIICEQLTNIDVMETTAMQFPSVLGFLEMFQVEKVEHLNIKKRWKEADSARCLQCPIGMNIAQEALMLDLHEKAHGPHGIIAGMTGSGKSELLITLILSLGVSYHPNDVNFILIDYKGGGMAKAFEHLPHIAGIITNLDGSMIQRSLNSLDSELLRRQRIFSQTGERLGQSSVDIYVYQKLFHDGLVDEALPHLCIVADEFAELKQQQPEFMEQLIRSARIGRSLGIHLLLATQKPSGVVDDQIWSNSRFHICLKVQEKADSMDMLKREDGALLADTGRFFLQVGYNEIFEEGQSAYAKAVYAKDVKLQRGSAKMRRIDVNATLLDTWSRKEATTLAHKNELQEISKHIQELAQEMNIQVRQLWMPALPEQLILEDGEEAMIALVDEPQYQRQYALRLQLANIANTLLYAMNLEASVQAFEVMILQLSKQYKVEDINFVIFDFDQGKLARFVKLPQVFCAIQMEDEDDIMFLKGWLLQALKQRSQQVKQQKLIVVIHHLAAFLEQYEEYENLLYKLARDGARYGIYVWLSAISLQDVRFRLQSQFSNIFVFQMHDESDISSIIGEHRRMPTIFGRALWKNQEVYEVQMAYSDITSYIQNLIVDETALHLCHLDAHVDCKEIWRLYQPDHSLIIPIGMDKLQRTPCTISLQDPWIVSGSGAPSFCRELKNLLAPRNDQMIDEHDLKRQEFQMKSGICYLSPSFLVANSYATWMQSLLEEKHLLWIGEGIEEVSYVLHLPSSLEAVSGMDGYVIEKEITAVRFMEDV